MKKIRLIILFLSFVQLGLVAQSIAQRAVEDKLNLEDLLASYSSEQLLEKIVFHSDNFECDSVILHAEQFIARYEQENSLAENTLQSDSKVMEAEYEFDLEHKALEYQQLLDERRVRNQSTYIGLVSFLLLMVILAGYISWRSKKQVDQLVVQLKTREAKLSATNGRLGRFVRSISHDMMNKLEYILFMGNTHIETHPSSLQRLESYYTESRETVTWLKTYCRDLLAWSESDIAVTDEVGTDLMQIVEDVLNSYEFELEQRQFDLEIDDLPTVSMVAVPLKQVFQNLIDNSIKYTRETDSPKLKIISLVHDGQLTILVKDNGQGISEDQLENIFENPGIEAANGRGLGFVKDLLDEYGHEIWATENEWGGASFYFTVR